MKIQLKKSEQGTCPYCEKKDIDYGAIRKEDDEYLYYPVHCNNCNRDYEEWYKLAFTGLNVGDNRTVEFNPGDAPFEIDVAD